MLASEKVAKIIKKKAKINLNLSVKFKDEIFSKFLYFPKGKRLIYFLFLNICIKRQITKDEIKGKKARKFKFLIKILLHLSQEELFID